MTGNWAQFIKNDQSSTTLEGEFRNFLVKLLSSNAMLGEALEGPRKQSLHFDFNFPHY